jgi:hypothetical protein
MAEVSLRVALGEAQQLIALRPRRRQDSADDYRHDYGTLEAVTASATAA